jgi:FkbM family methyltransferase
LKKNAFGLYNTAHGSMIVNRFDYHRSYEDKWHGIGAELLEFGEHNRADTQVIKQLLTEKRKFVGDPLTVLDCGANIGVFSVEIADFLHDWGLLIAVEAQERLFYALAGNLAVHNCFNARAIWAAIDAQEGFIDIPEPNYCAAGAFSSFELQRRLGTEDIGQKIDYDKPTSRVRSMTIDYCSQLRIDFIRLDIEGMELQALAGATKVIERDHPVIFINMAKIDRDELEKFMTGFNYKLFAHDVHNVLAIHLDDPVITCIQVVEKKEAA